MTIPSLNTTDTFKTWFDKTNTIISEVNGITVHNIFAGDGIGITSVSNNFTISHGNSVTTGVTFSGVVNFTNTVSFANSPSVNNIVAPISPKVSGLTSGNVVRMTTTGLTFSKADSVASSEVLGIIVGETTNSNLVALSGSFNNSQFSGTISNLLRISGGTLSPGCAYFLSPTVAGGVTTYEPVTYGQVSKPVVLGISGDMGSILLHRGIQVEGISAGITAELDNKIIIQVNASADYDDATSTYNDTLLVPGNIVLLYDHKNSNADDTGLLLLSQGPGLIVGSINNDPFNACAIVDGNIFLSNLAAPKFLFSSKILGMVSKVLSKNSSTKTCVVEVTLPGGSFIEKISNLDPAIFLYTSRTTGYYADKDGSGAIIGITSDFTCDKSAKFLQFIRNNDADNTARIIFTDQIKFIPSTGGVTEFAFNSTKYGNAGGISGGLEYDNLLPNGTFSIWQRGYTEYAGITKSSLTYANPIADRWFYLCDIASLTGITLNITRHTFDDNQLTVPGSPKYWIDLKQTYTGAPAENYRPRFENVQRNARLLQGQTATISFYAYAGICGATVDLVYNRYVDNTTGYSTVNDLQDAMAARTTIASSVELSTNWKQYSYSFVPTAQSKVTGDEKGWFTVGFEFPSSGVTLSIAQVKLELGSDGPDYVYITPEKELEPCKPYYLRTYDWDQSTRYTGTSRLNEHILQLGNLLTQKEYYVKFPVEMVQTPITATLYALNGVTGEAYNVNKQANMDITNPARQFTNLPWDTGSGAPRTQNSQGNNIIIANKTVDGMSVRIDNGATHLDTLQFHYVIDSDFKLSS